MKLTKVNKQKSKTLLLFVFSIVTFGIAQPAFNAHADGHGHHHSKPKAIGISHGIAVIEPTQGNQISGIFYFSETTEGVSVRVDLQGLKPNQNHGVHVHQFGDRSAANGSSAGGHYNPEGHPHGLPPSEKRHAGSFGNLKADKNGRVQLSFIDTTISLQSGKNPILGRAVVVHANPDDGSQPSGNAGPRIGVGVIGIRNTTK